MTDKPIVKEKPKVQALFGGHEIHPNGAPHPDTIKALEKALERARSGEVQSVAIVMACVDGFIAHDWFCAHHPDKWRLLGGISHIQHLYNKACE